MLHMAGPVLGKSKHHARYVAGCAVLAVGGPFELDCEVLMSRVAAHFSVSCAILCSALIVFATMSACSSPKPQTTPPPQPASAPSNPPPSAQPNSTPAPTASAQPQTNPSATVAGAKI